MSLSLGIIKAGGAKNLERWSLVSERPAGKAGSVGDLEKRVALLNPGDLPVLVLAEGSLQRED
ncbi:MAG: hypothetical protein ACI9NQ_000131 [Paracoccaceae bacterium]|jgi:hypothetical protein